MMLPPTYREPSSGYRPNKAQHQAALALWAPADKNSTDQAAPPAPKGHAMSNQQNQFPPKLLLAGLWEKVSSNGNRYFTGRLGNSRILIFENRDRAGDNEPSHLVYLQEGNYHQRRQVDQAVQKLSGQQQEGGGHDVPF